MNSSKKIVNATKWSAIAELVAKLISPVTNIILARLLTPEMFGIVVTVTLVISFADIFSDAGFQRYIVQHNFPNEKAKEKTSNVAFTFHLFISLCLWGFIYLYRSTIANLVGSPEAELAIVISCISLPIAALSSIQMALFRRDLDYKRLFKIRFLGVITPLFVTVPLAYIFHSYWALIIGTIASNIVITVSLTIFSKWKPHFCVDSRVLHEMMSFSLWSLAESVLTWLTSYIDIMILSNVLTLHYIGVYKTAMVTSNQILSIVTATTTTVLFSSLSRAQNNESELKKIFFSYQRIVSYIVVPLGVGIYLFRDVVSSILLGSQWGETAGFIGLWGVVGGFYLLLGSYASEMYRAIGKPKISAAAQAVYIVVIIILLQSFITSSFETLYTMRTASRVLFILIHFILLHFYTCISPLRMMSNIFPSIFASFFMAAIFIGINIMNSKESLMLDCMSIVLCVITYAAVIMLIPSARHEIFRLANRYIIKK